MIGSLAIRRGASSLVLAAAGAESLGPGAVAFADDDVTRVRAAVGAEHVDGLAAAAPDRALAPAPAAAAAADPGNQHGGDAARLAGRGVALRRPAQGRIGH